MNSRHVWVAALAAGVLVSACSASTTGHGRTAGSSAAVGSGSTPPNTTSVPAGGSGAPTDAAGLGALLQAGIGQIQTAHLELAVTVAGQSIIGRGDEKLDNGKIVAFQITESIPGAGDIELVIADGKTYAKLPTSAATPGKPWVLVSPDSTDPTIKRLASTLDSAQSSASLGTIKAFVAAADSVRPIGPQTIGATATTHYSVVVNPAKLPSDFPGRDAITQAGISSIPVELYLDDKGRPVQVTEKITAAGQAVDTKVTISKYNQPVSINPPPASQVSTK